MTGAFLRRETPLLPTSEGLDFVPGTLLDSVSGELGLHKDVGTCSYFTVEVVAGIEQFSVQWHAAI